MKKILTLVMSLVLVLGLVAPAMAAEFTYTAIQGGKTEFDKYFVLDADAEVPAVEFSYTVEGTAGKAAAAGQKMAIIATNASPHNTMPKMYEKTTYADAAAAEAASKLGKINFTKGQTTSTDTTDEWVELDSGEAFAKHTMVVDFSGVSFDEPGIYRYKITEAESTTPTLQGLFYDTQSQNKNRVRYLDVYVNDKDDDSKTLQVVGYVLHENDDDVTPVTEDYGSLNTTAKCRFNGTEYNSLTEAETAANNAPTQNATDDTKYDYNGTTYDSLQDAQKAARADIEIIEVKLDDKSQGYVNEFATYDLEFGKEVEGNQASRDKYFKFNVTINGLTAGTVLQLNVETKAHKTPTKNSATTYEAADMAAANSIDDDNTETNGQQLVAPASGTISKDFYLQDGQYIGIKGLPVGVTYSVTETAEDYKSTEGTDVDTAQVITPAYTPLSNQHKDAVSGTIGRKEEYVQANDGMFWKNGNDYKPLYAGTEANAGKVFEDAAQTTEHTATADRYKLNDQNVYTGYTNTRDGVIPTGIMMSIAGGAALVAIAGAGILVLNRKKREED